MYYLCLSHLKASELWCNWTMINCLLCIILQSNGNKLEWQTWTVYLLVQFGAPKASFAKLHHLSMLCPDHKNYVCCVRKMFVSLMHWLLLCDTLNQHSAWKSLTAARRAVWTPISDNKVDRQEKDRNRSLYIDKKCQKGYVYMYLSSLVSREVITQA